MKTLKSTVFIAILIMIFSCGGSERIITEKGDIYTVKGDKIIKNGEQVNANLNTSEKEIIYDLVDRKKERKEEEEKEIKKIEEAIEEQEKIENQAKEKQRELKNKLEAFNNKISERQDAREDYVKVKNKYNAEKREFNKLKSNGMLSAVEMREWELKLEKLKAEAAETKSKF